MKLFEALTIKSGSVVAFVGAGGKTTAIWCVAQELSALGKSVLITSTTKMHFPKKEQCERVIITENPEINHVFNTVFPGSITVLGRSKAGGKLIGVRPGTVCSLKGIKDIIILVEADGAAGLSFKAPAFHEPVVPNCADVVVPVMGLDILGKKATYENIHRLEQVKGITGLKEGDIITPGDVAAVLCDIRGYRRKDILPREAKWIPLLNKSDLSEEEELKKLVQYIIGRELACRIVDSILTGDKSRVRIWGGKKNAGACKGSG